MDTSQQEVEQQEVELQQKVDNEPIQQQQQEESHPMIKSQTSAKYFPITQAGNRESDASLRDRSGRQQALDRARRYQGPGVL